MNPKDRMIRDLGICADYQSGLIGKALADKWQVSECTVLRVITRAGIARKSHAETLAALYEGKILTPQAVAKIMELHDLGLTPTQIGAALSHGRRTVVRYLAAKGLEPNRRWAKRPKDGLKSHAITREDAREIMRLRVSEHLNLLTAARRLGYSIKAVNKLPADSPLRGVMTKHGKPLNKVQEDIVRDYASGMSYTDLQAKHGVSDSVILRLAREAGIARKAPPTSANPPVPNEPQACRCLS